MAGVSYAPLSSVPLVVVVLSECACLPPSCWCYSWHLATEGRPGWVWVIGSLSRVYASATCCAATSCADDQHVAGNKQHVAGNKLFVAGNKLLVTCNMLLVRATILLTATSNMLRATCCAGVNAALQLIHVHEAETDTLQLSHHMSVDDGAKYKF